MLDAPNRLEAELFKTWWDDGLLDLFFGLGLLTIGIGWWFDQAVLAAVAPALLWIWVMPLRKAVVEPRAGYVEFSRARQQHAHRNLRITLLLGLGTFLLGVGLFFYVQSQGPSGGMDAGQFKVLQKIIPALPAALLAIGAFIGAQFTGAQRFVVYGMVLLVAAGLTLVYDLGPAVPMLVGGTVITLSGMVLLIRFLRASARFAGEA